MTKILVVLALAGAVACSKDKTEAPAKPAATPAAAAPAPPSPAPSAAPAPSAGKLGCDKVFPQALRDKYFSGSKVVEKPKSVDFAVACDIGENGDKGNLDVTCHDNMKAAKDMTLSQLRDKLKAKDVPGLGAGAVIIETGFSRTISAFDDDSNCQGTITVIPKEVDAVALAKDLLAAWPAK